jgi:hypothetical protein
MGTEGDIRLKSLRLRGLTCSKPDAYHWLFIYDFYVEMSLYG